MVSDSLTPLQSHKGLLSGWVFSGQNSLDLKSVKLWVLSHLPLSDTHQETWSFGSRSILTSHRHALAEAEEVFRWQSCVEWRVVRGSESPICFNYCSVEIWWSIMEHEQLIYSQFLCLKKLFEVRVDQPSYGKSLESTEVSSATRTLTVNPLDGSHWTSSKHMLHDPNLLWFQMLNISPLGAPSEGVKNIQERHFSKCWAALKLADALQQSGNKWDSRRLLLESISTWAVMLPANIAVHISVATHPTLDAGRM